MESKFLFENINNNSINSLFVAKKIVDGTLYVPDHFERWFLWTFCFYFCLRVSADRWTPIHLPATVSTNYSSSSTDDSLVHRGGRRPLTLGIIRTRVQHDPVHDSDDDHASPWRHVHHDARRVGRRRRGPSAARSDGGCGGCGGCGGRRRRKSRGRRRQTR